jgi:uncharacterized membrane protein YqhA
VKGEPAAADRSSGSGQVGGAKEGPAEGSLAWTSTATDQEVEDVPRIQQRFERLLARSRLLILLPVIMLLIIAAGTFVYGAVIFFASITGYLHDPARVGGKLSHFLIVEDLFLVGVTLMISAFGFYGLFVIRGERREAQYWLPQWLRMRDLEDLKARVVSMVILVAAMTFVDVVVEFQGDLEVFYLGIGVSLVIVALTAFLRFGRQGAQVAAAGGGSGPSAPSAPGIFATSGIPVATGVPIATDAPTAIGDSAASRVPVGPGVSGAGHADADVRHEPVLADQRPAGHAADPPPDGTASRRAAWSPSRRGRLTALFGTARRDGAWNVAPVTDVIAVAGGARLDLRDAVLPGERITIRTLAALGGVSVTIPPEMRVTDSGLTFFGVRSITGDGDDRQVRPDAPLLAISGLCVFGGVRVRRRPHQTSPG